MTNARLEYLLFNALLWIEEENADFFVSEVDDEYEWFRNAIGITKEEMNELGIELNQGENDDEENEE